MDKVDKLVEEILKDVFERLEDISDEDYIEVLEDISDNFSSAAYAKREELGLK